MFPLCKYNCLKVADMFAYKEKNSNQVMMGSVQVRLKEHFKLENIVD